MKQIYTFSKKNENRFCSLKGQKKNFKFYNNIYEMVLKKLASNLNKAHNKNYNLKFWRINIGPYLQELLGKYYILFYTNFKVRNKKKLDNLFIKSFFLDTKHFSNFISSDTGYRYLNSKILNFKKGKKYRFINIESYINKKKLNYVIKILLNFLLKLYYIFTLRKGEKIIVVDNVFKDKLSLFNLFINGSKKYFLFVENLSFKTHIKKINFFERNKIFKFKRQNNFFKILENIIIETFPIKYFENFEYLVKGTKKKYNLKYICNTSFSSNDYFKIHFINKKNKMLIYQHGGRYFLLKQNISEAHEFKIKDKFISLGFDKKSHFLRYQKKINYINNEKILYVEDSFKLPQRMGEGLPMMKESINLEKYQINLQKKLKQKFECNIKKHPINENRKFNTFKNHGTIIAMLKKYNLIIIENIYSTSLLEILQHDFPYLIFMNKKLLNMDFKPHVINDIKILQKSKIFHTTEKSIINFLNKNIKNIDKWWNLKNTRNAHQIFKKKYLVESQNFINDFENSIN